MPLPSGERVTALDDVLLRIESEINASVDEYGNPPAPFEPEQPTIDPSQLPEDSNG